MATGAPQELSVQPNPGLTAAIAVSPFAAQATPAPAVELGTRTGRNGLGWSLDPPNLIEEQSVSVTTITQQSSETAVGEGKWTQWVASNQEDYAAYDVDF